jgi:putative toxin-antitoxin system antitoxin component (TIGR02293 family)
MAKDKNGPGDRTAVKGAHGVKSGKGKPTNSVMPTKYAEAKSGKYISVANGSKSSRIAGALMTPITTKPESQMTSIEKMEATREGISKKALEELKEKAGFDYDQLSEVLGVARTTLLNKKGSEKFPLGLSEKIMSLADLYSFGYEIFGDPEEFNQWIFQPLPALGGQAPYALLDNQYGREEVKNVIGRIAYGAYS